MFTVIKMDSEFKTNPNKGGLDHDYQMNTRKLILKTDTGYLENGVKNCNDPLYV